MRRLAAVSLLALALPAVALATKPPTPGHQGKAAPQVLYILKGTLTAYTAANGASNGSVSLLVKSANRHGTALNGQTLTFPVTPTTKIVTGNGTAVTVSHKGLIQIRGPKKIPSTTNLATALQALTARQVIDQGPAT